MKKLSFKMIMVFILLVTLLVVGFSLFSGGSDISWSDLLDNSGKSTIFWQIRLPRVLLGFIAGGVLAVSGMVFQALFRNPIASPYTLGVAGGASFGATVYITAGLPLYFWGFSLTALFSFTGALAAIFLVYSFSAWFRNFDSNVMILCGVVISFFFSSIIMFMQYLTDYTNSFKITRWTMGGLDTVGYEAVGNTVVLFLGGLLAIRFYIHDLNLISIDEELALTRGVNVVRVKKMLFVITSMMIGVVVAFTGPVGFIGIVAPHISRVLVGSSHGRLMLASTLVGGIILVLCDTIGRLIMWPVELPAGIITALVGGPFFLWLMVRKNRAVY